MNDLNPSRKPAAVRRAGGYMKHLNHITLGFVIMFVLAGCLAAAAQGVGVFTYTGDMGTARAGHTATLLPNGKVLVAGGAEFVGYVGPFASGNAELYDPATGIWTATGSLAFVRAGHTATLLPNGKVLVAGGGGFSAELYDPATGAWSSTGSLNDAHVYHTATLLPNGKVLVAGGDATGNSAELYDPATANWTRTGSLGTARYSDTATLLPSGKVLVAGGFGTNGYLASAELYDPATGHWSPTGSLGTARVYQMATLLPNGKALIAGGSYYDISNEVGVATASAELYDPATGVWTLTGSLGAARDGNNAILLANGQLLVAGGDATGISAELYDPATGVWSSTGSLNDARSANTATLLPNGQVLIAGGGWFIASSGDDGDGNLNYFLSDAELYNPGVSLPNPVKLGDGSFQFGFIKGSGPSSSVLAGTNLSATVNTWTNLGAATERPVGSGLFQFTDHQAPNYPQRFYRVSSP
jgi:WD40 repeat protein